MKLSYIISVAAMVVGASAQVLSIGVKPAEPAAASSVVPLKPEAKRLPAAGSPLLGYIQGPGPADLQSVVGKASAAKIGDYIAVPENTKDLYLAPRGLYALLQKTTDDSIAVWTLRPDQADMPIAGMMPHIDSVAFSPRGNTALFYASTTGTVQVVSGLPAQPAMLRELSLSSLGTPSRLAVSDDGALVVAAFADSRLLLSNKGATWIALPSTFSPQAWSFLPNSHDLAISDTVQKTIVLMTNLGDPSASLRILAQGVTANLLAISKDGAFLAAGETAGKTVWTIDLKAGTVTERPGSGSMETMAMLRDGFTVILATAPGVSVMTLPQTSALRN